MSLKEAVLEIAEQLEKHVVSWVPDKLLSDSLCGFAQQLRTAVKAAGDLPANAAPPQTADFQHFLAIQKEREEIRAKKIVEEGPRMVEVAGTIDMVPVPGDMPVGAKTLVDGKVHELHSDGRLHAVSA